MDLLPVAVAALVSASAFADELPTLETERWTLPNGLTVILHEANELPKIAVNVTYAVGAVDEPKGQSGFAHLFEHLMFQATLHVVEDGFFRLLEAAGATDVNARTFADRTEYFESLPSSELELALWLESERMGFFEQGLTEKSFLNQKRVVENERLERSRDVGYGVAELVIARELYPPPHPLSDGVIGSPEDLERATLEDARKFHEKFYGPGNATLVIAGDIDSAETRRLVEKYFGTLSGRRRPPRERIDSAVVPPKLIQVEEPVARQARVTILWKGPPANHEDVFDLEVFANILTQSLVTRVGIVNWKEQTIDAIDANVVQDGRETLFRVDAIVSRGIEAELGEIRVQAMLDTYKDYPPSEEEVFGAWNGLELEVLRALQHVGGGDGRANWLQSAQAELGDPARLRWRMEQWRRATAQSVRRVLGQYLGQNRLIVIAAPKGAVRAKKK